VKAAGSDTGKTSSLSRDHTIHFDNSGLLTIAGGKWTTYRHMAEDCVDHAITLGRLDEKPCVTRDLRIHGHCENIDALGHLAVYGSDAEAVQALAAADVYLAAQLDPALPYIGAEVVWAARKEMARTVDDVISRRTRALFLNARAAQRMIEPVATLLARELGRDDVWRRSQIESASAIAAKYVVS
jgi:glycerol-3-phosphate dehydrogenase